MEYNIPQGLVLGAFLFTAYVSAIQDVIKEDLTLNCFADDHSLRRPFDPNQTNNGNIPDEDSTIAIIDDSMQDINPGWVQSDSNSMNQKLSSYILEAINNWQNINIHH